MNDLFIYLAEELIDNWNMVIPERGAKESRNSTKTYIGIFPSALGIMQTLELIPPHTTRKLHLL